MGVPRQEERVRVEVREETGRLFEGEGALCFSMGQGGTKKRKGVHTNTGQGQALAPQRGGGPAQGRFWVGGVGGGGGQEGVLVLRQGAPL